MTEQESPARGRPAAVAALILTVLLSGLLTWEAGRSGLFAFDQSILFDGGYRVWSGQVPFRDFVAPFGPVSFWVQGALFGVFGVGWRGYLESAVTLNGAAVLVSYWLVRRLLPRSRMPALLGAALTGVWFLAPSGTPWVDSIAFLWALLALWALARAATPVFSGSVAWSLVAGLLWSATFLTKQNAGLALLLPIAAWLWSSPPARAGARRAGRASVVLLGAVAGLALFVTWLFLRADPGWFFEHAIRLPTEEGAGRVGDGASRFVTTLLTGMGPRPVRVALLLVMAPALTILGNPRLGSQEQRSVAATCVFLFLAQNLFLATSNNQPEISLPFAGLLAALGAGLAWDLVQGFGGSPAPSALVVTIVLAVAILLAWTGVRAALSRDAHDVFGKEVRFERSIDDPGLEPLRWGEPTRIFEGGLERERLHDDEREEREIGARDVEDLLHRLRGGGRPFFAFPDWTFLYGVVGVPSPQPLLWFHPGLTYPRDGDPELDRRIVSELRRHGVERVVLEEVSWMGTERRLDDFPLLSRWIAECFRTEWAGGGLRLLDRTEACRDLSEGSRGWGLVSRSARTAGHDRPWDRGNGGGAR